VAYELRSLKRGSSVLALSIGQSSSESASSFYPSLTVEASRVANRSCLMCNGFYLQLTCLHQIKVLKIKLSVRNIHVSVCIRDIYVCRCVSV
jgi:hypothetical protein